MGAMDWPDFTGSVWDTTERCVLEATPDTYEVLKRDFRTDEPIRIEVTVHGASLYGSPSFGGIDIHVVADLPVPWRLMRGQQVVSQGQPLAPKDT